MDGRRQGILASFCWVSWMAAIVDGRMFTTTAWEDEASMQRVMRGPAHRRAMELALSEGVGTSMYTGVWQVGHQNPLFVRCTSCAALSKHDAPESRCRCGAELPPAPPFW